LQFELIEKLRNLASQRPELQAIVDDALSVASACKSLEEIKNARIAILGKKGLASRILKGIGEAPQDERPLLGQVGNLLREVVSAILDEKEREIEKEEVGTGELREILDVTLPGRRVTLGKDHVLINTIREIIEIFVSLGYTVESGPEVEYDYYNFEALNTPAYHPARSLQDTFYVRRLDAEKENPKDVLLRTHTSPVQVRVMESRKPPLYVVSPGKAYRKDEIDATHSAMFFQVEGFAVDSNLTMGHLKGTLEVFIRKLFGSERKVRFRPHFFPFTEPSAEVDVSCFSCGGKGCSLCKHVGWLEILGCGMIDPNVFKNVGYDPEEYTGFAFGMGIERIAMMKYGIEDMRLFYEDDLRFLSQF